LIASIGIVKFRSRGLVTFQL